MEETTVETLKALGYSFARFPTWEEAECGNLVVQDERKGSVVLNLDHALIDAVKIASAYPTRRYLERGTYGIILQVSDTPCTANGDCRAESGGQRREEVLKIIAVTPGTLPSIMKEIYIGSQIAPLCPYLYPLHTYYFSAASGTTSVTNSSSKPSPKSYAVLVMNPADEDLIDGLARGYTVSQVIPFMHQLVSALDALHSLGILHMDIKPGNVLIRNNTAHLADFGLCVWESAVFQSRSDQLITHVWKPPETLTKNILPCKAADIWSLGITFLQLLVSATKQTYFKGRIENLVNCPTSLCAVLKEAKTGQDLYLQLMSRSASIPEGVDFLWPLLFQMLQGDPKKRPTTRYLVQHFCAFPLFTSPFTRVRSTPLSKEEEAVIESLHVSTFLLKQGAVWKLDCKQVLAQWQDILNTWHRLNAVSNCDLVSSLYCVMLIYWSGKLFLHENLHLPSVIPLCVFEKCIPGWITSPAGQ